MANLPGTSQVHEQIHEGPQPRELPPEPPPHLPTSAVCTTTALQVPPPRTSVSPPARRGTPALCPSPCFADTGTDALAMFLGFLSTQGSRGNTAQRKSLPGATMRLRGPVCPGNYTWRKSAEQRAGGPGPPANAPRSALLPHQPRLNHGMGAEYLTHGVQLLCQDLTTLRTRPEDLQSIRRKGSWAGAPFPRPWSGRQTPPPLGSTTCLWTKFGSQRGIS